LSISNFKIAFNFSFEMISGFQKLCQEFSCIFHTGFLNVNILHNYCTVTKVRRLALKNTVTYRPSVFKIFQLLHH
jgi:hypothetical protein